MTLRWARGQEGRFDAPLSSSGFHLPLTKKGLLAPFRPQSSWAPYKKASASLHAFLCSADLESLCDIRRLTAADAVYRYDLSCEKALSKSPQAFGKCKIIKIDFRCIWPKRTRRPFQILFFGQFYAVKSRKTAQKRSKAVQKPIRMCYTKN